MNWRQGHLKNGEWLTFAIPHRREKMKKLSKRKENEACS